MRTRVLWMLPLICAPLFLGGCGDDSGTSAKDDESSSSVAKESSSSAKSSSSVASSSSKVEQLVPYTTECPAGKTCTYAPTAQLNPEIDYGEFLDTRDYQVYKTVTIGTQTWMAQNLNYAYRGVPYSYTYSSTIYTSTYTSDSTSWCYNNVADYCAKFGRLYTWAAAIDSVALVSDADNPQTCGYETTCDRFSATALAANPIRGVCPGGWHLPSYAEWDALFNSEEIGGTSTAGTKFKSTSGWLSGWLASRNGEDSFGFAVLPAGSRDTGGFSYAGDYAFFWSSSEYGSYDAYSWYFYAPHTEVFLYYDDHKYYGHSVRCLRDSNDGGSEASSSSSQAKPSSSSSVIPGTAPESSSVIPSSSSSVIPSGVEESSSSVASSSSVDSSSSEMSSSETSSSSKVEQLVPYTTECPAGKTCTYAPTEQLNPKITYGEFLDTRDYQVYKTVTIGSQTWMAENLNYADSVNTPSLKGKSWCYDNDPEKCAVTGRLYTWAAAIDFVALANDDDRLTDDALAANPIQGVCPSGWHLPSKAEWNTLFTAVGDSSTAGEALKSISGWYRNGNGTDASGFSALPAGYRGYYGYFTSADSFAYFWSASQGEYPSGDAYFMYLRSDYESAFLRYDDKYYGHSVRCLKD